MRGRLAILTLLVFGAALPAARAEVSDADFPIREVARPLVAPDGMTELQLEADELGAPRAYDASGNAVDPPDGSITRATSADLLARYGVFRGMEVRFELPWTVTARAAGESRALYGSGRAQLGAGYELDPAPRARLAGTAMLVLPTTAQRMRTDPTGTVAKDHLAVAGTIAFQERLGEGGAARVAFGGIHPFPNADDLLAARSPPSTLFGALSWTQQLDERFWARAAASATRTNRDRVAGGIVPRSDQYVVDAIASAGFDIDLRNDVLVDAWAPLAGHNTPRAYGLGAGFRIRF